MTTPAEQLDDEQLLARIRDVSAQLAQAKATAAELYETRAELFREGRRREPPILQRVMAEAAGVSDVAVVLATKEKTVKV